MKLYRCKFYDIDDGLCVSWHASRREVERNLRDLCDGLAERSGRTRLDPLRQKSKRQPDISAEVR